MDTLYYNIKPGLRLHIRLKDASTTLGELIQRVQEIEEMKAQLPRDTQAETKTTKWIGRSAYPLEVKFVREKYCWECGKRGPNRSQCRNPRKKLCSWSRKKDIQTRDCQCQKPENARRTGLTEPAGYASRRFTIVQQN